MQAARRSILFASSSTLQEPGRGGKVKRQSNPDFLSQRVSKYLCCRRCQKSFRHQGRADRFAIYPRPRRQLVSSLLHPRLFPSLRRGRRQLSIVQCLASPCSPPVWRLHSTSVRLPALPTRHMLIRLHQRYRHCRASRHLSYNNSEVLPSRRLQHHRPCRHLFPARRHRNQRIRTAHKEAPRLDGRARHMSLRHVSIASERISAVTINGPALAAWHLESR
jgi:hypothetical protein